MTVGDTVREAYDVGDREPRVGTVHSIRIFYVGTPREETRVMVRWPERTTPQKSGFRPRDLEVLTGPAQRKEVNQS